MELAVRILWSYGMAFLHECAHALVAFFFCIKTKGIKIYPFGLGLKTEEIVCPMQEIWISSAGPLLNLLLFFVLRDPFLKFTNLAMLLLNLLPILPLDGGRILRGCMLLCFPLVKTVRILNAFSWGAAFLLIFGILLSVMTGSLLWSVCFIGIFLLTRLPGERRNHMCRMMREIVRSSDNKKQGKIFFASSEIRAFFVLRYHYAGKENLFLLTENGHIIGILREKEILNEIIREGSGVRLGKILENTIEIAAEKR